MRKPLAVTNGFAHGLVDANSFFEIGKSGCNCVNNSIAFRKREIA